MPKIPKYESQGQFKQDVSGPRISPETAGQATAEAQRLGPMMAAFGNKMIQIAGEQQVDAANTMALQKISDIKLRADAESDLTKLSDYESEVDKVKAEAAKTISVPFARSAFANDFDRTAISTKYSIRSDFQAKQIKQAQADLVSYVREAQNLIPGMSEPERLSLVSSVKSRISRAGQNGILGATDSVNMWQDFRKNVNVGMVERDMMGDPAAVAAELEKGKNGVYADLAESDRTDMITKAHNLEKKQKIETDWQLARFQDKNENDLTTIALTGVLTDSQVRESLGKGEVSASWAKGMIAYLQSPKTVEADTKAEAYVGLLDRVNKMVKEGGGWFKDNTKTFYALSDLKADILNAAAKGEISKDDAEKLLIGNKSKGFKGGINSLFDKRGAKVFQDAMQSMQIHSDMFDKGDDKLAARHQMYSDYIDYVQDGMDPNKAVTKAIQNNVNTAIMDTAQKVQVKVKVPKLSEDQIKYAMEEYDLTREQVIDMVAKGEKPKKKAK